MKISFILLLFLPVLSARSSIIPSENFTTINEPETVAVDYLKWYKINIDRLNRIPIYKAGRIYTFDSYHTGKYLKEFENSGFVSETYMNKMRQHFNDVKDHMKKTPQNDGAPWELDYDFILRTQETDAVFDYLDNIKISKKLISGDKAIIALSGFPVADMLFNLSLNKGRWVIDELDYDFAKKE